MFMGRKQEARKYGAPLYCAAWPEGDYALVAGGGGKKSSGISNRYSYTLSSSDLARRSPPRRHAPCRHACCSHAGGGHQSGA